jgi:acyl-CoA synthetase (AMP-forming)/AMP-acid ligase II
MNVGSLLEQSAERYPNHTALVYEGRRWTYIQWYLRVRRFAQALSQLGVRASERVALYTSACESSVTTHFAAQLLGAVAVAVNSRLAASELAGILRDSGARVLIYEHDLAQNVLKAKEQAPSIQALICCAAGIGDGAPGPDGTSGRNSASGLELPSGHLDFETLAEQTAALEQTELQTSNQHLAALVYTSGTTGRPKGVMHSHANDVAISMNCVMEYGLRHSDIALHVAPLYHVGGMQAFFIPHLMVGATNIVLGRYTTLRMMETIQRERITTLFAVPTQLREMLLHERRGEFDVSSLRMITTGGAAIPAVTLGQLQAQLCPNIYNGYGMTEASLTLLLHPEDALRQLGSCGKPTLITRCRIVTSDPERRVPPTETVAVGTVGELIVNGPQVTAGYWQKPAETDRKLRSEWFYTGDLFSRDAEGFYHFHGRADDLIISGGENIYPREVEEILYRCPGVREAAVVGLPDPTWGSIVVAFVVRSDPRLSAETVDRHCRMSDELASFKRPRQILFLEALPTNSSGKVLKRVLVSEYSR